MDNTVSMLRLQADLINGECRILDLAIAVCETNNLPETARNIRLTNIILREAATLVKIEADKIGEFNQKGANHEKDHRSKRQG